MESMLSQDSQLLADPVLLKDGGHVTGVNGRDEDLSTDHVDLMRVHLAPVTDLHQQNLQTVYSIGSIGRERIAQT